MMGYIIAIIIIIGVVCFIFGLIGFLSNHTTFKSFRTLKSQIDNSREDSDVKLIFYNSIQENKKLIIKLKSFNTDIYDSNVINHAMKFLVPSIHQEMRDLISCTGEFRGMLTTKQLKDCSKKWDKTREEIIDSVLETKVVNNFSIDNSAIKNSDLDDVLNEIKVKAEHLDSVISKSLHLNSLDLKNKYYKSSSKETKLKIIRQLKDIAHHLDRDIYTIAKQKDNEIINHLNINERYLKKLETDWNQE